MSGGTFTFGKESVEQVEQHLEDANFLLGLKSVSASRDLPVKSR